MKTVRKCYAAKDRQIPSSAAAIIERVAAEHGVTVPLMLGRRRTKQAVMARFDCWSRMREELQTLGRPVSYPKIAMWFDRDHASIISGVQRAKSVELAADIEAAKAQHARSQSSEGVNNSTILLKGNPNSSNLSAHPRCYQHLGSLNATT